MAEGHLSNDEFFVRLSALFDERRQKDHGSIFLTQKRLSYDEDKTMRTSAPDATISGLSEPAPIIIRASNGKSKENRDKKVKLSTIVEVDALEAFFARYAEVCKSGMSSLKKRDRSKRKKETKAKKRKAGNGVGEDAKRP
ncbi:signal recognition particle 14kD protein [Phlyctema vagabunda]|uniref:Signal recognition particle subunit SRP14 n=1 Tax=Phlyctema vagabunda TaxID=108571 RepID=A0ABR4PSF5_9HELO